MIYLNTVELGRKVLTAYEDRMPLFTVRARKGTRFTDNVYTVMKDLHKLTMGEEPRYSFEQVESSKGGHFLRYRGVDLQVIEKEGLSQEQIENLKQGLNRIPN